MAMHQKKKGTTANPNFRLWSRTGSIRIDSFQRDGIRRKKGGR